MAPTTNQSIQGLNVSSHVMSKYTAIFVLFLWSLHEVSSANNPPTIRQLNESSSSSSLDECLKGDTMERFAFVNDAGTLVLKSCEWAAYKNTVQRCENPIVEFNCPITCLEKCQASTHCQNYSKKFKIKEVKANLKCSDGRQANGKPKKHLCRMPKFAYLCPVTCKQPCSKSKKRTCQDKGDNFIIKDKVPTQKVTCDGPVKSWSREDSYCYNSKFNAYCPITCNRCLSSTSPSPSLFSSRVPSITPTFLEQPSSEPSDAPSDVPSDEPSQSMVPTVSMSPTSS